MGRFDERLERRGTNCLKWDVADSEFGQGEVQDIIPMWVADMDFETPKAVSDAIIRRATHGAFGYSIVPKSYYESIINWMRRRHGWEIKKEWIAYTPGVIPALYWSVGAFSKAGDKILVQSPVYYVFYNAISAWDREVVCNQLVRTDKGYQIDFVDLEEKLSDPKVSVMLFCSPHNPVGRVWTREEIERVSDLCTKYNVLLVSDEIHSDLVYKGHVHIPSASVSEVASNNTIVCVAPSKTFNLAGVGAANVIIPNEGVYKRFCGERRKSGIYNPDIFGAIALEAAYSKGEDWLEDLLEYLQENYNYLECWFSQNLPQIKPIRPEGTYLIWIDFSALGMSNDDLKEFLDKKARLALDQGAWFGSGGEGFARMNIACHRSTLETALERLKIAISDLQ